MTYKILYCEPNTPAEITRLETKALSSALEKADCYFPAISSDSS